MSIEQKTRRAFPEKLMSRSFKFGSKCTYSNAQGYQCHVPCAPALVSVTITSQDLARLGDKFSMKGHDTAQMQHKCEAGPAIRAYSTAINSQATWRSDTVAYSMVCDCEQCRRIDGDCFWL